MEGYYKKLNFLSIHLNNTLGGGNPVTLHLMVTVEPLTTRIKPRLSVLTICGASEIDRYTLVPNLEHFFLFLFPDFFFLILLFGHLLFLV